MGSFTRTIFLFMLFSCNTALAGCAFFASPDKQYPEPRPLSPVELFIVNHTPGTPDAKGVVSDPAFGDNLRIVLEQEFSSASGEICRRASLFSPEGDTEVVVMCRDADSGIWVMAPRVWGQGLRPVSSPENAPPPGSSGVPETDKNSGQAPSSSIPQEDFPTPERTVPTS